MDIHEWGESFKVYAPFETILSDMAYEKFHLFQSDVANVARLYWPKGQIARLQPLSRRKQSHRDN
jgi:hypothetical protein